MWTDPRNYKPGTPRWTNEPCVNLEDAAGWKPVYWSGRRRTLRIVLCIWNSEGEWSNSRTNRKNTKYEHIRRNQWLGYQLENQVKLKINIWLTFYSPRGLEFCYLPGSSSLRSIRRLSQDWCENLWCFVFLRVCLVTSAFAVLPSWWQLKFPRKLF